MDTVLRFFETYAERLPLELFVFLGAFIEEALSPIPSFLVMIPAGAAAQIQGLDWWYLGVLALIGGVGRVLASMLLYVLADKAEDWLFGNGRRFFGISHVQMERFGAKLRQGRRDGWAVFTLSAVPVLPTALLSLACGFVKVDFRAFVVGTYFGSAVNAFVYMLIGYGGIQATAALRHLELAGQIASGVLIIGVIGWLMYYRRKRQHRKNNA